MCWSQPARVDHLHKKWRAREKKIQKKMGKLACLGANLWPVSGRGSTPGQCYTIENVLFFKTFFEACPYIWKC
jgi:hypothetical protein